MESEQRCIQLISGDRLCVRHVLSPGAPEAAEGATRAGSSRPGEMLSRLDFARLLLPLLCRHLPWEGVDYHSFHLEFLAEAIHGEEVLLDIRVEKQEIGKGWKIFVRCSNASGEFLSVAELVASAHTNAK